MRGVRWHRAEVGWALHRVRSLGHAGRGAPRVWYRAHLERPLGSPGPSPPSTRTTWPPSPPASLSSIVCCKVASCPARSRCSEGNRASASRRSCCRPWAGLAGILPDVASTSPPRSQRRRSGKARSGSASCPATCGSSPRQRCLTSCEHVDEVGPEVLAPRLHPDGARSCAWFGAGLCGAGERGDASAGHARQGTRHRGGPGRSRHQRRRSGRAAGAGAPCRHGPVLRGERHHALVCFGR